VLSVVVGHLELEERRGRPPAGRALDAARRGIDIARGFLERGRWASATPSGVTSVATIVTEALALLDGALDEDIEVVSALDSDLAPVAVDPCALHSALLNLVLNARDALLGSGRIVVSARMLRGSGARSARYVEIAVSDDGAQNRSDVAGRVVERLETTGGSAQRSGLDLVPVRDFVERCGGCVRIERRKEGGTRVRMQLPTLSGADVRTDFVAQRLERASA
jgi:signal transduction histidine kinase